MRTLILALTVTSLSGCFALAPPLCPGTRAYDPQICRGEKWVHIPNPPYYALQLAEKCNKCIDVQNTCGHMIPTHCKVPGRWQ